MIATIINAQSVDLARVREQVRSYRQTHELEIIREFAELLALPNRASDKANIRANADAIGGLLAKRGIKTRLLSIPGAPPVVYGEKKVRGAKKTVIIYAHYDGQDVNLEAWTNPPFEPTLRRGRLEDGAAVVDLATHSGPLDGEWRLYGRSAGDDKAPIIALAIALDALAAAGIPLSVNLKIFFEGEEEAGSPHLGAYLKKNRRKLRGDLWLFADGPVHQSRKQQIFLGVRGVISVAMTIYGPVAQLHSGHYGNWAPNPAMMLAELLATVRNSDGAILIENFHDDVIPLTEADKLAIAATPNVTSNLIKEFALGRTEGGGLSLGELIMQPAINIRGIKSGGRLNAIPTDAEAYVGFRLVPDQTPARVKSKFETHVMRQGYTIINHDPTETERRKYPRLVKMVWSGGYPAVRLPLESTVAQAVISVAGATMGEPIVITPSMGGSLPLYLFKEILGASIVGLPIANHDDNQHAPNENLRLQNLWDGIELFAGLLAGLGEALEK